MNRAPFHDRTAALGAEFHEARGWERPQWYASNGDLVSRYGVEDRPHEWDRRWWSPIIDAEHLHLREKVGMVDLSAFQIFDVSGPGVVPYLERLAVNRCDVRVGRAVYTPLLTPDGGIRADLTIQRLAGDRFRVVTGAFDGARDEVWFRRHLPADGTVQLENRSSALCTIGVWGPDARALLSTIADIPLSQEAFPYGTVQEAIVDGVPATLLRISYVGESGWEIYTGMPYGARLWDAIREAGRDFDARPVGIGVYGTTGRLEKGYALMGADLGSDYSPVEAGLARAGVKDADFIGKPAYLQARAEGPAAKLCTLTMDAHTAASGTARFPTGGNEPILTRDGGAHRGRPRPRVPRHLRRHGAVRRQVPPARLPAGRARARRHSAADAVHERDLPGDGGRGPRPLRSREPSDEGIDARGGRLGQQFLCRSRGQEPLDLPGRDCTGAGHGWRRWRSAAEAPSRNPQHGRPSQLGCAGRSIPNEWPPGELTPISH